MLACDGLVVFCGHGGSTVFGWWRSASGTSGWFSMQSFELIFVLRLCVTFVLSVK